MQKRTLKRFLQSTLALVLLSSCVTVPNVKVCSVAGVMTAGAICAETISGKTSEMDFNQLIDFLEPQQNPKRAGAVFMSSEDFNKVKTALEEACRELGPKCGFQSLKLPHD